jgi:hypothetical protein
VRVPLSSAAHEDVDRRNECGDDGNGDGKRPFVILALVAKSPTPSHVILALVAKVPTPSHVILALVAKSPTPSHVILALVARIHEKLPGAVASSRRGWPRHARP